MACKSKREDREEAGRSKVAMAGIVASASKGVIDSVLAKLNELIVGDNMCLTNLLGMSRGGIGYLKYELSAINALLEELEDADDLDPQAKNWRNQVREITYDIEDWIDEFTSSERNDDAKDGFISRISQFLETLRSRVRAAEQIKDLKTRLQEINERRKRYKIGEYSPHETTKIDTRLPALYNEATSLVGIENPKEDLIEVIDKANKFKIVSIVGFGGLGKTTLANEVYREVRRRFDRTAFVSISQKPDVARILKCILSKLDPNIYSHHCEVQDLIDNLREHLHDKRYFIIIDDLWDTRVWNIISCAFPRNNQNSMVMITTRIVDVARAACCRDHGFIYRMKPLTELDSRKLLLKRIFGPRYDNPLFSKERYENPQFMEVSCEIIKKCGGLPLAIISVASILACQPKKLKQQWDYINNSLATKLSTESNFEDMMHILDLSYKNLSHHLKACFLYLGTYPEDHKISKVELIRRWVAEGFVSNSGQDGWHVAENYFNELVNRSMIQPAYEDCYYDIDEVSHCRVHDMMLELIVRRCKEDNFISFAHDHQVMAEWQDKAVRRLTVKWSGADDDTGAMTTTCHLAQVRSLAIFGGPNWIPLPHEFKLLRVLYLDIYRSEMTMDLSGIDQLAQLRYLKVGNERSFRGIPVLLPCKIRRLRHLETLELPALSVCCIPSDVVHLPCLSHLVVPHDTKLPDGIGKVKTLRTMDGFDLSRSSLENISAIGELTNLRNLSLHCHTQSWEYASALGGSLKKLSKNLKRLSVSCTFVGSCVDALGYPLISLDNLELLDMSGCTFGRSRSSWLGYKLHQLRVLRIGVWQIQQEDIDIIGTLGSLVQLHLRTPSALTERIVIARFPFGQLKVFELECDGISRLTFEAGAMPRLRKLWLAFDPRAWDKGTPAGLQHLSSLKEIYVLTVRNSSTVAAVCEAPSTSMSETAVIRGAFQEVADAHPGRPEFTLGEAWLIRAMESPRTL